MMCMVVCFLSAVAHNIYTTHCNFHCGGDGTGGCIYLSIGGIVAEYCGWIVVSKCTCGCCSAPA